MVNSALLSSARGDWNTPESFLDLVRQIGNIGLDPCSNSESTVDALVSWDKDDDGLAHSWGTVGLVYVNPPYGRQIGAWVSKCAHEAARGVEVLALVPSRTDTKWFQDHASTAAAVCFMRGRLRFVGADNAAPFPSAVLYWGARVSRFRAVFGAVGLVVPGLK